MQGVRIMTVLACALAAAASATAPQARQVKTTAVVSGSADAAWDAIIDLFAENNWAITNIERSSGLITTDWMSLGTEAETYADCGGSGIATVEATSVRFNVRVKELDDGASVMVGASFRQRRSFDGKERVVDCVSKGAVEKVVHQAVRARSGQARAKAQKPAQTSVSEPRGHFCASSAATPDAGLCTRRKGDCARARDAILAVVPDASECSLTETAWCYVDDDDLEHCFLTAPGCATQATRMAAPEACTQRE